MRNRIMIGSAIAAVALLAAAAVAVAGSSTSGSASALPKTCGPLFYKGSGSPRFTIVSDLPLQGAGRAQNLLMGQAIRYTLEKQYNFKAGKYTVGYQECDDSTAQAGRYDPATCSSNARAYASTSNVIGVLGTFNSGCSKLVLPILNRAPGGPVPMVSSANTAVGLTHFAPWNDPGEPNIYYPTKKRNYVRVAATDDFQGPAMADFFRKNLKKRSVYILQDNTTFGKGVAQGFQARANKIGLKTLAFDAWSEKATDYTAIAQKIKDSGAQSVYLGGLVCDNGVKLLKDLRSVLGPKIAMGGPDGWTPESATLAAGSAAQGFYITYAGQPLATLGPTGKKYIAGLRKYAKVKGQMPPYPIYQGQSTQVLMDAIARSNGTRTSVSQQLFKTNVKNGIMGTFHFDKYGDITPTKYITIEKLKGNAAVYAGVVITKVKA
ncbi:MAG TPA: branched-chain amino acid ABC transporter substrate-binding protein [Gaiellaceae bacterium]|nr:branched-chain amino acid ABC transporter substrate-binding protein [Gaiellaceae bacterium]